MCHVIFLGLSAAGPGPGGLAGGPHTVTEGERTHAIQQHFLQQMFFCFFSKKERFCIASDIKIWIGMKVHYNWHNLLVHNISGNNLYMFYIKNITVTQPMLYIPYFILGTHKVRSSTLLEHTVYSIQNFQIHRPIIIIIISKSSG